MAQLDVTVKPLPTPTAESAPYWEALREHRLVMQRCNACGRLQFYPRSGCRHCGSVDLGWEEMSGRGNVYTFTVIHRAPFEAFAADVPYVYAVVELEEGPRVVSTIETDDHDSVAIDMAVTATYDDVSDTVTLLRFLQGLMESAMSEPFALPAEIEDFRRVATSFTQRHIAPLVDEAESNEAFPRDLFKVWGAEDLLGLSMPEQYGGSGGGKQAEAVLVEETARVCAGFATSLIVQLTVVPTAIASFGTEEQRSALLPGLIRGDLVGSLAVTEPGAGSDARSLTSVAARVDGGYEISGAKVFITNGTLADFYLVAAVVEPTQGHRGIGLLIVRRDNPGLVSVRKMHKTSVRSSDTAELSFDRARVSDADLLGGDLNGFAKLMSTFDGERVIHAARAIGLSRACFEAANTYASQRQQFGAPIRSFQAVSFKLADMVVGIDASRLLVYRAAARADAGLPYHHEASVAKLFATETARTIATEAMQIHGSYGLTAEFPLGRYVMDAHLETIGTGTSEIQRVIIARSLEASL